MAIFTDDTAAISPLVASINRFICLRLIPQTMAILPPIAGLVLGVRSPSKLKTYFDIILCPGVRLDYLEEA
jgi:hypothetical protein